MLSKVGPAHNRHGVFPMIVFLIDADSLSSSAWIEEACSSLEASEGKIAVRRAYGSAENLKGLAQTMLAWAIRPFVNLSLSKNTTDLALAVDAMELACETPKPTVMAIGSGGRALKSPPTVPMIFLGKCPEQN